MNLILLVLFWARMCSSFVSLGAPTLPMRSHLAGIAEWRDTMFNFPGTSDDFRIGAEDGPPPKEICILPFPFTDCLLQGETKQLRLYEERFIKLFDTAMEKHSKVVGMGLVADSGIIQTVPLCEIEAYNRMEGFGIFVTIRVIGRAQIDEISQQEPFIKAICREIEDKLPPNLELPNLVASNIENLMLLLSSMEHRLEEANKKNSTGDDGSDDSMQRRINVAKLEDRFYEEKPEESDDEDVELDRLGRFRQAFNVALDTDTQGYRVVDSSSSDRTPQELTAVSWAAFCTDIVIEEAATFRIQALDCDSLLDRLKLASHMLREKKTKLQVKMQKAGLQVRDDFDQDDGDDKSIS